MATVSCRMATSRRYLPYFKNIPVELHGNSVGAIYSTNPLLCVAHQSQSYSRLFLGGIVRINL